MIRHEFFHETDCRSIKGKELDAILGGQGFTILFLWGPDCPNCDFAKKALSYRAEEVRSRPWRWFDVDVYEESEVGTRFGLHGIPVFVLIKDGKTLGKITSFPGVDPFFEVLDRFAGPVGPTSHSGQPAT